MNLQFVTKFLNKTVYFDLENMNEMEFRKVGHLQPFTLGEWLLNVLKEDLLIHGPPPF